MKFFKIFLFILYISFFCGCTQLSFQGKRFENTLAKHVNKVEALEVPLQTFIAAEQIDSIWHLAQANKDVLFYIFNEQRLVFWSNNWLAISSIDLIRYDQWFYCRLENAIGICKWKKIKEYNLLTIIPIKFNYAIETQELHNSFIPPFDFLDEKVLIDDSIANGYPITLKNQTLLSLSVNKKEETKDNTQSIINNSFSYHTLAETTKGRNLPFKEQNFYILSISLIAFLVLFIIFGVVRHHGFRNMTFASKILYLFMLIILISYITNFFVSVHYIKQHYQQQQQQELQSKTRFIQSALQNLYFWDGFLSPRYTTALNTDLRDLSYNYHTDIHIYDLNGTLIGTSIPEIFTNGLVSTHISPKLFFEQQTTEICQIEKLGNMEYLASYAAFYNGNFMPIGYIELPFFISTQEMSREVNTFLARIFPMYVLVIVIALGLAYLLIMGIVSPISEISTQLSQLRVGQQNQHINYNYNDEIGKLVSEYNNMVDQLEHSTSLLAKTEREMAWRTMARQIAHEINNPLTPMKLTLQQLQRLKNTDKFEAYFQNATAMLIEQIDNLGHIATSFSDFAKMPEPKIIPVDIAHKLTSAIDLFKNNTEQFSIRYIGPDSNVWALTDEKQISEVFINIIKNAIQAIENIPNGDIIIILKVQKNKLIHISISDNGCGIPQDVQDKIFIPNFTTKSTGTGLGLAISKNIIENSGGTISFELPGKGTTFIITLPETTQRRN